MKGYKKYLLAFCLLILALALSQPRLVDAPAPSQPAEVNAVNGATLASAVAVKRELNGTRIESEKGIKQRKSLPGKIEKWGLERLAGVRRRLIQLF